MLSRSLSYPYLWVISHWLAAFPLLSALWDVHKLWLYSPWNSPSTEFTDLLFSVDIIATGLVRRGIKFHLIRKHLYFCILSHCPVKRLALSRNLVGGYEWLLFSSCCSSSQTLAPFFWSLFNHSFNRYSPIFMFRQRAENNVTVLSGSLPARKKCLQRNNLGN